MYAEQQLLRQEFTIRLDSLQSFSKKTSIVVTLIGCVVILGWIFDIAALKSVWPGLVAMKVNTASCFIFGGISLRLWHCQPRTWMTRCAVQACAMLVLLIGLLTLFEYGFNFNLGIDQLLFKTSIDPVGDAAPGRMAIHTAVTFVLIGCALVLLSQRRPNYRIAQLFALLTFLIAYLCLLGYVYGNAHFYRFGSITSMAVHTAIAFLLLSLSILFARPNQGLTSVFISNDAGGIMAQRLFPSAIVFPPVVCWLILSGSRLQIYSHEMGTCLLSILNVVIFAVLIWWNARELSAIDRQRWQAETALKQTLEELEMRVEERTLELKNANRELSTEIVQRQWMESALLESEERFRRAVIEAPFPLIIHAEDDEILQISAVWTELTGYTHNDIPTTADWTEKAYGQRKELVQADIKKLYNLKSRVVEGEYTITTSSGETRIWDFSSAPLGQLPDGRQLVISMAMDVTKRKRTELALFESEERLKISLQEKEVMLKEIHHRVKNNLQIISSLLNLQAEFLTDNQVLDIFKVSQSRIEAMALIHEKLYQSEELVQINFSDYIQDLVTSFMGSYIVDPEAVTLKVDINNVFLGLDAAIPCSLIINELVLNSIKHAFSDGKQGEVCISIHSDNDKIFTLQVSDNGVGLPPDFDLKNTESLGLQLVNALTNQLQGHIELFTHSGVAFKITFPIERGEHSSTTRRK